MATIIMLPFTLIDYVSHPYIQNITWIHITALIATAVIGTVLFYSVYQYTIKHTDSVTVSLFTYLQPIFAIILSIVLLSESVNLIFIIGTATTLVGAYLASNK
jgi:drug/metabolite transporter (DMT)-like permease